MATKLYVTDLAGPFSPATFKGSWNLNPTATRLIDPLKAGSDTGGQTNIQRTENTAANPFRMGLYRGVTLKLAAQTISGTMDMVNLVRRTVLASDIYTKVYAWVTQGDTDTVRGVVLNYEETVIDTSWPHSALGPATGQNFTSAQSVSSVAVTEGDHLVIEWGFISYDASLATGVARMGARGSSNEPLADQIDLSTTQGAPYFILSHDLVFKSDQPRNITPEDATAIVPNTTVTQDPTTNFLPLHFSYTPAIDTVLSTLFCCTNPAIDVVGIFLRSNGSDGFTYEWDDFYEKRVHTWPVTLNRKIVWRTYVDGSYIAGALLSLRVHQSPAPGSVLAGDILILEDASGAANLYDPTFQGFWPSTWFRQDGTVIWTSGKFAASEQGCSLASGIWGLFGKQNVPGNVVGSDQLFIYSAAPSLALIARVTMPKFGRAMGTDLTKFYVAANVDGFPNPSPSTVYTFSNAGILGGTTWTLNRSNIGTSLNGGAAMGVKRDSSVLYYTRNGTISPNMSDGHLHSHNLLTDADGIEFTGPGSSYAAGDVIVLSDNTILCIWNKGTATESHIIYHYDAAGNILHTYDFGTTFVHHIIHESSDVATSIIVWTENLVEDASLTGRWDLERLTIATGARAVLINDKHFFTAGVGPFDNSNNCNPEVFGAPDSCPLIMMMTPFVPPPPTPNERSGIYKIVPGKHNDTLWNEDFAGTTDFKIPNPSWKTGLLGE